jgi:hypothetical protein
MYAKIFRQIYDSSLADSWNTLHVFVDLLVWADADGVVDMTVEALCRRTNARRSVVLTAIERLEAPDPASRTPDEDGRRIVRLDAHRAWGWRIVNYAMYRNMRDEESRREQTRKRVAVFRERKKEATASCNAPVTLGNAVKRQEEEEEELKKESLRKRSVNCEQPVDNSGRSTNPTDSGLSSEAGTATKTVPAHRPTFVDREKPLRRMDVRPEAARPKAQQSKGIAAVAESVAEQMFIEGQTPREWKKAWGINLTQFIGGLLARHPRRDTMAALIHVEYEEKKKKNPVQNLGDLKRRVHAVLKHGWFQENGSYEEAVRRLRKFEG